MEELIKYGIGGIIAILGMFLLKSGNGSKLLKKFLKQDRKEYDSESNIKKAEADVNAIRESLKNEENVEVDDMSDEQVIEYWKNKLQ